MPTSLSEFPSWVTTELSISPNGQLAVATIMSGAQGQPYVLEIFDLTEGKLMQEIVVQSNINVPGHITWLPDNNRLAWLDHRYRNTIIKLADLRDRQIHDYELQQGYIEDLSAIH